MIRVLAVDDNAPFLEILCDWIGSQSDLELVGNARNGKAALEEVGRTEPDLVLLDAFMPTMNGFEVCSILKQGRNAPSIILLSLDNDKCLKAAAEQCGADGFVAKSELNSILPALIAAIGICPGQARTQNEQLMPLPDSTASAPRRAFRS